jgi:hypothetical protein
MLEFRSRNNVIKRSNCSQLHPLVRAKWFEIEICKRWAAIRLEKISAQGNPEFWQCRPPSSGRT